jgi:hypothetical protein
MPLEHHRGSLRDRHLSLGLQSGIMPITDIRLPTVLMGRYVRYVIGFGVAVGVGLAPFLGKYKVPLFEALLELIPESSKHTLIPLSAFLMGLVAVAIQFYAGDNISQKSIRRRFTLGFAAILIAFIALVLLYTPQHVLPVPDPSTGSHQPVILGWSRLPAGKICTCTPTESDLDCLYALGGPESVEICWPSVHQVRLSLHLLYLILTGGFGGLIGALLFRDEARRQAKEKAKEKETRRQAREEALRQAEKKKAPRRVKKSKPADSTAPGTATAQEAPDEE